MNKSFFKAMGIVVGSCLMLSACAPTSPRMDRQFGESVRMSIAQQILNPDAAANNVPDALDGMAARNSVDRYRNSFREPPAAADGFTIGLGSGRSR